MFLDEIEQNLGIDVVKIVIINLHSRQVARFSPGASAQSSTGLYSEALHANPTPSSKTRLTLWKNIGKQ